MLTSILQPDTHQQIIQRRSLLFAWRFRQLTGFVRCLQFSAQALEFRLVKGDVRNRFIAGL